MLNQNEHNVNNFVDVYKLLKTLNASKKIDSSKDLASSINFKNFVKDIIKKRLVKKNDFILFTFYLFLLILKRIMKLNYGILKILKQVRMKNLNYMIVIQIQKK